MKCGLILELLLTVTVCAQTYPNALRQTNAQLTVIPLPNPAPDIGNLVGANRLVVVQPYNTTIVRCTDVNTDPTNTRTHSYEVTDTGGDNVVQWNSNQTMLRVVRMAGGTTGIVGFDPATGTCTKMNPASIVPSGGQWSLTDPNVDYYQHGTVVVKRRFDYAHPLNPPMITDPLFDVAQCKLLTGLGNISYRTQLVTTDDNIFFFVIGVNGQVQDTAQYVIGYRLDTGVCILYNTLTGSIQQAGGIPDVLMLGQVSPFYAFTIHSMYLAPGGQLIIGVGSTCTGCPSPHGPFVWYAGTTHLDLITKLAGGHETSGFLTYKNVTSAPKIASRPFTDLNAVTFISSNTNVHFPSNQNIHMGWQNVDPGDTAPLCMSEMSLNLPQPIQIASPLQNEIFCADLVNLGTWIRLAPTFSSGQYDNSGAYSNFRTQQAIMANGKLGYIAFSSDWEGTLGNSDGKTPTCTLGTPPPTLCRSDVFIVIPHATP